MAIAYYPSTYSTVQKVGPMTMSLFPGQYPHSIISTIYGTENDDPRSVYVRISPRNYPIYRILQPKVLQFMGMTMTHVCPDNGPNKI
jgi:hypothetical protein